ncbi:MULTISPECIES: NADH-quinone oxidoreductase subunit N [unclassified Gilliamella]|uniref:NADH-quinone oxidoreductase subunit N n=1 Tax=unclassified Gilliamella TaxID=2685620 RepID=UPI001325717B|nr:MULTISPECIES: NADH-quinone oxidoreductase subunit N [unclassified Gilliamella]MWN31725.1 NADH-quinone oxidoreductase subunit NuoN [Gilliamella sp. Pra-s60]MWP28832.1 NADH-quinone oxidoreductase subunit NuoN [Gilliamella sp. Pra-s54]
MIALSPIFVLSFAIIALLFSLFIFKINTKCCTILTVCGLSCALMCSVIVGYKISFSTQVITDISSDNMQISVPASEPIKEPNSSSEETIAIDTVPNEESGSANGNENININDNIDNNNNSNNSNTDINTDTATNVETNANSRIDDNSTNEWKAHHITALFTCDGYGLLYTSLILMISIAVACFAYRWFKQEQKHHGLFYLILLFMTLGGVTLVYSSHLIAFFIGIELLSIPFVGLIGYQYTQTHSLEAAVKYMILSAVASVFLLMGIAFYYATTGELTFSGLSYQLSTMSYPSTLLLIGVCLMLVGIGFKLSLVPFQLWLPDVYQGAPTVVALLLSTVGKVAVFCAIARLFLLAPIVNNETIRIILVMMAFCSILWGNLLALMQSNLKRLLAYSSIAHFGYLLTALIAVQYQVLALETIGVYLIGYILANICILGAISLDSHSDELQDHENEIDLSGLFWRRPILALSMGVGFLSLAGVPLTAGFIGRFLLVLLGVTAELWWLVAAIVIGSSLGLYFYARLIINLYIRPISRDDQATSGSSIKLKWANIRISELIIVLCALLTLLCGVYPKWLFNLVSVAQYLTT